MVYKYPFKSNFKIEYTGKLNNQDYYIWLDKNKDLQKIVTAINLPIIEIGGPSQFGFFFLDKLKLNSKPIITNVSNNPIPYADNAKDLASFVETLVDGRNMPFDDKSIGVFLMSGMSISSDWWVRLSEKDIEKNKQKIDKEFDIAQLEMEQVALGTSSLDKIKYAQRIQIFNEIYRALDKGGLFFSDGALEDLIDLKLIGFTLVAYVQMHIRADIGWQGISYEFVVQK